MTMMTIMTMTKKTDDGSDGDNDNASREHCIRAQANIPEVQFRSRSMTSTRGYGELRMIPADLASRAVQMLNGSQLGGATIQVKKHAHLNHDCTKLAIMGIPAGVTWQDLKNHFEQCGPVHMSSEDLNDNFQPGVAAMQADERARGGAGGGGKMGFAPSGGKGEGWKGGGGGTGFSPYGDAKGRAGKGGGQSSPKLPGALTGTVRFKQPMSALEAMQEMNGCLISGVARGCPLARGDAKLFGDAPPPPSLATPQREALGLQSVVVVFFVVVVFVVAVAFFVVATVVATFVVVVGGIPGQRALLPTPVRRRRADHGGNRIELPPGQHHALAGRHSPRDPNGGDRDRVRALRVDRLRQNQREQREVSY